MFWVNVLSFLLLIAGHTELVVTVVNQVHARRIGCRALRRIRHVHDVLIPAFPLALVWGVGIRGPGLLRGGSWWQLPLGWTVYLGLCLLGTVVLAISAVRWLRRTVPHLQLANHSQFVDIEDRLGYRPIGDGPFRWLARWPGNEAFRVEVVEKTFRLPRLPPEWDGLSILLISDLHFIGTLDRPFFEEIAALGAESHADVIVFTGDLLDDARLLDWLPDTLGSLQTPLGKYFVLGNHDWFLDSEMIRRTLTEQGWQDVAGKMAVISSLRGDGDDFGAVMPPLVIAGTEQPWMGEHPDFSRAADNAFRILLSHSPDNLRWARRQNVDLMLCGHNHGGQVVLPVIGPVYSPSRFGVRYASGAFWEEPTLMYVSRGLSARHPFRWNCPPELPKLVLRARESLGR